MEKSKQGNLPDLHVSSIVNLLILGKEDDLQNKKRKHRQNKKRKHQCGACPRNSDV